MARTKKRSNDFYEILSVFRRRIWLLGFFLLGVLVAIVLYNELVSPLFLTEFSIMYEEMIQPIPDIEFYRSNQRRETLLSNQIEEINSRQFFLEVAQKLPKEIKRNFKLQKEMKDESALQRYLSYLIKKNTEISVPNNNSNVIKISYTNEDREGALQVAQVIADVISHRAIEKRQQNISSARKLIEDQLMVYKAQLDSSEKQLRDFKETHKISSLNQETNEMLRQITEAEVLLTSAESHRQATKKRLEYIHQKIQSEQNELMPNATETISSRLEKLKDRLVELELQRTDLLTKGYSFQHPKLQKLSEEISGTRESLSNETEELIQKGNFVDPLSQIKDFLQESITLEADLNAYEAQAKALQNILDQYDQKIRILPELELQLARLIRDLNTNEKIYTMLQEEKERTRIVEAQNIGEIRIIDTPELPTSPIRPRKTLNIIIGLLIGFIIGSLMIFIFESLDTSIKTSDDVERLTDLSVLGTIPKIRANVNGNLNAIDSNKRPSRQEINQLITLYDSHSYAAEAFRMLRTNLQFSSSDFRANCFLITSPQPGEGKSTTAINLAVTTAQMGYDTLLIDADLRRPKLHKIFRLNRELGLVDILQSTTFQKFVQDYLTEQKKHQWDDFLAGDNSSNSDAIDNEPYNLLVKDHKFDFESLASLYSEIDNMVRMIPGIEHFSILTTGSAVDNSSEVLGSKTMKTFISLLKKRYDVIFVDSPPVLVVTDTSILGSIVDGVLIVCTAGRTHQKTIFRTIEILDKGNTEILGIVLNKSLEENLPGSYKKYYQKYA